MPREYNSKQLGLDTEYFLEKAGYSQDQIKLMTLKDALTSLTVAVLRGINVADLEIVDISHTVIGGSNEYRDWDPVDLETARAMCKIVGGSSSLRGTKVPPDKQALAAVHAVNLFPPINSQIEAAITVDELMLAYAMAVSPKSLEN